MGANPYDLAMEKFDAIRQGSNVERSQFYKVLANGPFFGTNQPFWL
jgi:non-heme chloroperoxidase